MSFTIEPAEATTLYVAQTAPPLGIYGLSDLNLTAAQRENLRTLAFRASRQRVIDQRRQQQAANAVDTPNTTASSLNTARTGTTTALNGNVINGNVNNADPAASKANQFSQTQAASPTTNLPISQADSAQSLVDRQVQNELTTTGTSGNVTNGYAIVPSYALQSYQTDAEVAADAVAPVSSIPQLDDNAVNFLA